MKFFFDLKEYFVDCSVDSFKIGQFMKFPARSSILSQPQQQLLPPQQRRLQPHWYQVSVRRDSKEQVSF